MISLLLHGDYWTDGLIDYEPVMVHEFAYGLYWFISEVCISHLFVSSSSINTSSAYKNERAFSAQEQCVPTVSKINFRGWPITIFYFFRIILSSPFHAVLLAGFYIGVNCHTHHTWQTDWQGILLLTKLCFSVCLWLAFIHYNVDTLVKIKRSYLI